MENPPGNAGDARDAASIPGSGRSLGAGSGSPSSSLAWKIPWTEEPGWLQSWGLKEPDTTELLRHHVLYSRYSKERAGEEAEKRGRKEEG